MSATQKEQIWGFLIDAIFILKVYEFVFFAQITFYGFSSSNFTYIHITSLFTCIFFQIFLKLKSVNFDFFSKNPASMEAEL